jgi:hypothetical protein
MLKENVHHHLKSQNQCVAVMMLTLNSNKTCTRNQQLQCGTEITCCSTEYRILKKTTQTIIKATKLNLKFPEPKQWNFNATNEKVLELVLRRTETAFPLLNMQYK